MGVCNRKLKPVEYPVRNSSKLSIPYFPSVKNILDYYKFEGIIGMGSFGKVRLATSISSGFPVAIKSIDKKKFHKQLQLVQFKRELEILFSLDHPNLISFIESFDSPRYLHIVTEYCQGGDLCQYIVKSGGISEREASRILSQVLLAVQYLHTNGICHRDIKAENFLFVSKSPESDLKLIDFGLSKQFSGTTPHMKTFAGSPRYLAPEIVQKPTYDYKCDIWSSGVLLFFMLTGAFPFLGDPNSVSEEDIDDYYLEGEEWEAISSSGKDLIEKLLAIDPEKRLDALQALEHPWLSMQNSQKKLEINDNVLRSLKYFHPKSKLQREALQVIVKYVNSEEVKEIKDTFLTLDTQNTGQLTIKQIENTLASVDPTFDQEEIHSALEELDYNGDGRIQYSDFIAASLNSRVLITEKLVRSAFSHFDVDKSGFITPANLAEAFSNSGFVISNEEVLELIKEVDVKEQGQISYQEFKNAVLGE